MAEKSKREQVAKMLHNYAVQYNGRDTLDRIMAVFEADNPFQHLPKMEADVSRVAPLDQKTGLPESGEGMWVLWVSSEDGKGVGLKEGTRVVLQVVPGGETE
jgi:hypothetical protein